MRRFPWSSHRPRSLRMNSKGKILTWWFNWVAIMRGIRSFHRLVRKRIKRLERTHLLAIWWLTRFSGPLLNQMMTLDKNNLPFSLSQSLIKFSRKKTLDAGWIHMKSSPLVKGAVSWKLSKMPSQFRLSRRSSMAETLVWSISLFISLGQSIKDHLKQLVRISSHLSLVIP